MTEYNEITLGQFDGADRLVACNDCGAAVVDTAKHDAFHKALAAQRRHT